MPDGQAPTATSPAAGQAPMAPATEPGTNGDGGEPKVFDEAYVKTLRAEAAANRTKANELETRLKEFEDKDKTDAQKERERAEAAEKTAAESAQKLMRFEVAASKGLDPKYAELLTGASREEMETRADLLLEATKPKVDPSTFDGGARTPAPTNDMDAMIRRAAGR